ncbi:MAG: hypothetical protein HY985_12585 [Magnetospirillum sp.]|nr:hypothetical protein [Magnetospirillum sp.]
MGLGGLLFWTGLARNIRLHEPTATVAVVHPMSWRQKLRRRRDSAYSVFDNNPHIDLVCDDVDWRWRRWLLGRRAWVLDIDGPRYSGAESAAPDRIIYRRGVHTVAHLCHAFGIPCRDLRPVMVLRAEEAAAADAIIAAIGLDDRPFVCIEPVGKGDFTPNKAWFSERWDMVARALAPEIAVVQVGLATPYKLPGAIDATGRFSYRQMGRVLARSQGLISTMGGLVHLAKAVGSRSAVLVSGYEPLELATYEDDLNLYAPLDCSGCGLVVPCPRDRDCMRRLTVDQVVEAGRALIAGAAR